MSSQNRRRPLALSAILTASLTSAMGLSVSSAHAVNAGPADSALTVSDGTYLSVVGGATIVLPGAVTDAVWSPNGSRVAYVDGGDLVSVKADGSDFRVLAGHGPGEVISHPTWMSDGGWVAYARSVNGVYGPIGLAKADGYGDALTGGTDASYTGDVTSTMDGGADSAPDGFFTPSGTHDYSANLHLVYQHVPAGGGAPEIWLADPRVQPQGFKIADGSQPTVSADGNFVAFVNPAGQIAVIDLRQPAGAGGLRTPKVLTTDSLHKQHPTFSPDGAKIAYEALTPGTGGAADVAKDVESIPATGGSATVESPAPGVPAYRPTAVTHVVRLAGADRTGTAIAASQAVWATAGSNGDTRDHASAVVLSRSDDFADALGGSALAAHKGPLLLTSTSALDPAVRNEIVRTLGPVNTSAPQTVYVLGGDQALSPAVEKAVAGLGYTVKRLAGPNRYATSVAIANAISQHPYQVLVATGNNYADALSAGAAAGSAPKPAVVLLTNDKQMPPETAAYLESAAVRTPTTQPAIVYEVGGQAAAAVKSLWPNPLTAPVVNPLVGADRYATSFMVAREFFGIDTSRVGVATALNWPDSLSGGAVMGHAYGPLLLVDPKTGLTPQERQWVSANSGGLSDALIFGGTTAVTGAVEGQLGNAISGPAGFDTAVNPTAAR
ncbi:cell wall-binding repeat-containing protein [Catenulispora pinisilvae]|uniref:cell wall-binding repeat-containing protein n=1 Tax=Catenulispora pinisilvae TaxID=2705253 RepID=UPI0018914D54|nr:cell wall-binding repeat-containing protein [Catenulispora pinisilvae]